MNTQQPETLQLQQFLIARRSHLGPRKSMCDDNGKAAWDKYTAAADLIARQAAHISTLEAQQALRDCQRPECMSRGCFGHCMKGRK